MIGGLVFLDQDELPDLDEGEAVRALPFEDKLWWVGPTETNDGRTTVEERSRFADRPVAWRWISEAYWDANPFYGGVGIELPAVAVPESPLPDDHPISQRDDDQSGLDRWCV